MCRSGDLVRWSDAREPRFGGRVDEPHTAPVETLTWAWSEVLSVELVVIHDNFSERNRNSTLNFQVVARLGPGWLQSRAKTAPLGSVGSIFSADIGNRPRLRLIIAPLHIVGSLSLEKAATVDLTVASYRCVGSVTSRQRRGSSRPVRIVKSWHGPSRRNAIVCRPSTQIRNASLSRRFTRNYRCLCRQHVSRGCKSGSQISDRVSLHERQRSLSFNNIVKVTAPAGDVTRLKQVRAGYLPILRAFKPHGSFSLTVETRRATPGDEMGRSRGSKADAYAAARQLRRRIRLPKSNDLISRSCEYIYHDLMKASWLGRVGRLKVK